MSDDNEAGHMLRAQWFYLLRDIGDIELQRRKWLDPQNRNPHWSYIEFVCSFPDENQLKDACEKRWLTTEERKILDEFRFVLCGHNSPNGDDYDNAAVLNDPAWQVVVASARKAAEKLLEVVTDPKGRAALLEAPVLD